ncbi:MAG: hypothetical protein ACYDAR_14480 [Thermomicrobiales bacterium]
MATPSAAPGNYTSGSALRGMLFLSGLFSFSLLTGAMLYGDEAWRAGIRPVPIRKKRMIPNSEEEAKVICQQRAVIEEVNSQLAV